MVLTKEKVIYPIDVSPFNIDISSIALDHVMPVNSLRKTWVWGNCRLLVAQTEEFGNEYIPSPGIYMIKMNTQLPRGGWRIREDCFVELKKEGNNYIAFDNAVDEYGIGKTEVEAINDLLSSFADFRISLEKRENNLSKEDKKSLAVLRDILE